MILVILFKHGMARMTMLEKGTHQQWHPLVYSDLPTSTMGRGGSESVVRAHD